jgi:hypothetical protein
MGRWLRLLLGGYLMAAYLHHAMSRATAGVAMIRERFAVLVEMLAPAPRMEGQLSISGCAGLWWIGAMNSVIIARTCCK